MLVGKRNPFERRINSSIALQDWKKSEGDATNEKKVEKDEI